MSFIDLITGATINRGVDRWRATDGAVLIDVRSEEEYGQGVCARATAPVIFCSTRQLAWTHRDASGTDTLSIARKARLPEAPTPPSTC